VLNPVGQPTGRSKRRSAEPFLDAIGHFIELPQFLPLIRVE